MRGFLVLILFVSQILGLQIASAKYSWGGAKKITITHSHSEDDDHGHHHTEKKSDAGSKKESQSDSKKSHSHELSLDGSGVQFIQNETHQFGVQKIDSPKQLPFTSNLHESLLIGSLFRPPIFTAKLS